MAKNRKKPIKNVRKGYVRDPKVSATTKRGKTSAAYRRGGGIKQVNDQSGIEVLADGTKMGTGRTKPVSEVEQVRRDFAATEQKKRDAEVGSDLSADRISELEGQVASLGKGEAPKRKKTRRVRMAAATGAAGGTAAGSRPAAAVTGEGGSDGVVKSRRKKAAKKGAGRRVKAAAQGSIGAPDADTTLDTFGGMARAAKGESKKPLPGRRRVKRAARDIARDRDRAGSRGPAGRKTGTYSPATTAGPNTSVDRKNARRAKKMAKRAATKGKRGKANKTKLPKRIIVGAQKAARSARRTEAKQNKQPVKNTPKKDFREFIHTDEGAAHAVREFHPAFKDHSAEDIMGYVKSTGGSMKAFYDHVVKTHNAETQQVDVGPAGSGMKRSLGKITRWREVEKPIVDESGKPRLNSAGAPVTETTYESSRSYAGHTKIHYRNEAGENVTDYRHFDGPDAKEYPMSHMDYLSKQIHNWKAKQGVETKEKRSATRARGVNAVTGAILGAMGAGKDAVQANEVSVPTGEVKGLTRPPKGRSGRVQVTTTSESGETETKVTPKPRTYRPAKPPRKH